MNESSQDPGIHWTNAYRFAKLLVPQEPDFSFASVDISGMSVLEVIVPNETVLIEGENFPHDFFSFSFFISDSGTLTRNCINRDLRMQFVKFFTFFSTFKS